MTLQHANRLNPKWYLHPCSHESLIGTAYQVCLNQIFLSAQSHLHGLPIATVIGVKPAYAPASCVRAPEGVDETEIAGAIQGEPVKGPGSC